MENNSDKQLRDKLSSTEFPFDPQAWEQMEAMLDKKKKRRGFFWWWTGGVAAVLVLAVGSIGWSLYLMEEDDKQLAIETTDDRPQTTGNTIAVVSSGNEPEKVKVKSEKLKVNAPVAKSEIRNQKSEINSIKARNTKSENTKNKSLIASIRVNPFNPRHPRTNVFSKGKKQLAISNKQQHNSKQQTANHKPATRNSHPITPIQNEMEMLSAAAKASSEENIRLNRMEASLLGYVSENATTSFDKKEEDVLLKQKKKIFNYSIGVLANVTGTTLGKQETIPNVPKRSALFYSQPSYMVGLTHDFLFINRIAITNSILFSQTSFKVYQPKTVSFAVAPTNYTSHITELAIPIGIKVYPVVKNNFRFYINTGIINYIKLKETFSYSMPTDTGIASIPNNLFDPSSLPYQTSFDVNNKSADALSAGGETSTKDFSINKAKRYYASFYAGAGFEYVAKKHFLLFAEPMFYMSLQKIGVQDKRKYNFGLTGGFRYQF